MIIASGNSIIALAGDASIEVNPKSLPRETKVEKFMTAWPWVMWGDDNLLPNKILHEIEKDEVVFRSNEFNKATHYGLGLTYYQGKRVKDGIEKDYSSIPEVDDWIEANNVNRLFLELIEDYESLGNPISSMVLSKDRSKIALMLRKQASWSRWEKQDPDTRKVSKLYYNADWEVYRPSDNVIYDVLDINFPIDDLKGRNSGFEFIYRQKPIAAKRYYYDMANVEVLINSGNFEMRDLVRGFYKSRLKNGLGAAYEIVVTSEYLKSRVKAEDREKLGTDPNFTRGVLKGIKDEVDKWLSGSDNQGKTLIHTAFKENMKGGYEYVPGITIKKIDTKLEVDGILKSVQQITAQNFLAMGVDPSNIGLSNQTDGMNSGSEKKNAFYNTVATMGIDRLNTLNPFFFVAKFNGWTKKYPGFTWAVEDTPEITHGNTNKTAQ